jgi:hypothetical protein
MITFRAKRGPRTKSLENTATMHTLLAPVLTVNTNAP